MQDDPRAEPDAVPPVPSEREKWEKEIEFKNRELLNLERTQELARKEFDLKEREQAHSGWRSPVFLAIVGAFLAAVGNGYIAKTNGQLQLQLEKEKAEQGRILEMIKTGNPDKAAENLGFLLQSGLISDASIIARLRTFLREREPGSGPALPVTGAHTGIFGVDEAIRIEDVVPSHPVKLASRAVGRVMVYDGEAVEPRSSCSGFLVASDLLVTGGFCLPPDIQHPRAEFVLTDETAQQKRYPVVLPALVSKQLPPLMSKDDPSFALLRVTGSPGASRGYLMLATRAPQVGEPLAVSLFRAGDQQYAVVDAADCTPTSVGRHNFIHGCDAGAGSAGAPIFSRDGKEVLGVHLGGSNEFGVATRADSIAREVERFRPGQPGARQR